MLDHRCVTGPLSVSLGYSPHIEAFLLVREIYGQIRRRSLPRHVWAILRGRSYHLGSLHEASPGAYPSSGRAMRRAQVPIDRIVGSEGRGCDFDRQFVPLHRHTRERWFSVALAWYSGQMLPPVQLVAVGDDYYVRDGHHRISVARAFGADSIDAEIELWQAARAESAQYIRQPQPCVLC